MSLSKSSWGREAFLKARVFSKGPEERDRGKKGGGEQNASNPGAFRLLQPQVSGILGAGSAEIGKAFKERRTA